MQVLGRSALSPEDESVELWFNVSVYDKRKLFRTNTLLVSVRVRDLNDNSPIYHKHRSLEDNNNSIALDLASMHATHESASIDHKHYFLIFNRTARDPDAAENGSLSYFLHSVRADSQRFASWPLFFVPTRTGQLWVSLEAFELAQHASRSVYFYHVRIGCRDQRNRYDIIDVHVRLNASTYDEYKAAMRRRIDVIEERAYYFELDVEQAIETGETRVGYLPIRMLNNNNNEEGSEFIEPYEMSDEFGKYFNLSIGRRDGLVRVRLNARFYHNRARLHTLDHLTSRFSFVTARNEIKSVLVYFKFASASPSKFS